MKRLSTMVWLLLFVVASFLLYRVKYEVQNVRAQIAETSRQLEEERESLNVVTAEWAYLNRPERLSALASKYLSASALRVDQVAEIEAIPFPNRAVAAIEPKDNIKPASLVKENAVGR